MLDIGTQNPRDKFISICFQQREFKHFICFQLLSTIFTFQSFWRFHLAPSTAKHLPILAPRRGVVHVASQVSTERHAVRPLWGHPKARGASTAVTRRRPEWRRWLEGEPPKSSILTGFFHYKPSILGYPCFWNHPFVSVSLDFLVICFFFQDARVYSNVKMGWHSL